MAYTMKNYKKKSEIKADWLAGKDIGVYQAGGMFPLQNGEVTIEGPHYPTPHTWYARCYQIGGMMITLDMPGCKEENKRRWDKYVAEAPSGDKETATSFG